MKYVQNNAATTLLQLPLIPHINNVQQNNLNEQPILAQHSLSTQLNYSDDCIILQWCEMACS
jgi:hypothetical protein